MQTTNINTNSVINDALLSAIRQAVREEIQSFTAIVRRRSSTSHKIFLTVPEAAKTSRLAPSTIRLYIRKGDLKAFKVGRRVIVPRNELEEFLSLNPMGVIAH